MSLGRARLCTHGLSIDSFPGGIRAWVTRA
jgi:hypothetical protein